MTLFFFLGSLKSDSLVVFIIIFYFVKPIISLTVFQFIFMTFLTVFCLFLLVEQVWTNLKVQEKSDIC